MGLGPVNLDEELQHAAQTKELSDLLFADVAISELVARHMLGEADTHIEASECARLFRGRDRKGRVIRLSPAAARERLVDMVRLHLLQTDGRRFWLGDRGVEIDT